MSANEIFVIFVIDLAFDRVFTIKMGYVLIDTRPETTMYANTSQMRLECYQLGMRQRPISGGPLLSSGESSSTPVTLLYSSADPLLA